MNEVFISVISWYDSQRGRCDEQKSAFYDDLNVVVRANDGNCIVMGDFCEHVGSSVDGYDGVRGGNGW